jgi:hypothetical protein
MQEATLPGDQSVVNACSIHYDANDATGHLTGD